MVAQSADQDIGQHVQPIDQIELLEDHGTARSPCPQLAPLQRGDGDVSVVDCPIRGFDQAIDQAQERRFPCPRTANDADHLPSWDLHGHRVHRHDRPEAFHEAFSAQHCSILKQLQSLMSSDRGSSHR